MSIYKYEITMDYHGDPKDVHITGENILGITIDYGFDTEAIQPMVMAKLRLDRKFIDILVKNKDSGRMSLFIDKTRVDMEEEGGVRTPYIHTTCMYDLMDDVYADKTLLYSDRSGDYDKAENKEDAYTEIVIGLISQDLVEKNMVNQDLVIKDCNMMGAVCYFTSHMPMVIEPFTYNDSIDQLIIEPVESVKEIIKYLNNIKVFYDTPLRYFMDFHRTYLLSSSGRPVEVQGEQSPTVIISMKTLNRDGDALEQGINYNQKTKYYDLKILSNENLYIEDNTTDKVVNKLVGVIDPGREQSNPGIPEIIAQASDFVKGINNTIQNMVSDIGGGINNVVHGKNVMDYNTYRTEYRSEEYLEQAQVNEQVQREALNAFYQAALRAANSASSNNGTSGGNHSTVSKTNIKAIYDRGMKKVNDLNTQEEVSQYLEILGQAQGQYTELEGKSVEAGLGITSYESMINGVDTSELYRNLEGLGDKKAVNEANNAFIKQKAAESHDSLYRSDDIARKSIASSNDALSSNIANCEALYKIIKSNPISSGGGNNGSGAVTQSYAMSESDYKQYMEQLNSALTNTTSIGDKISGYYDLMDESVDDGVNYGIAVNEAQLTINPLSDGLSGLAGGLEQISSMLTGITSGIQDIANSIEQFTGNLSEQISQISQQGLGGLGIGDIGQLANGGIDNIMNLASVGKTGISHIESGRLNIMSNGGKEKVKYIDLGNDDPNKIKPIQRALELKGTRLTVTKDHLDNSVLTLNKEYIVNNTSVRTEQNGRYLLMHKQEIYFREGLLFICRTILDLNKL